MSEQAGNTELARRISSRIQGLEGPNSLWGAFRTASRIADASAAPEESGYRHNRFVVTPPEGSMFGPLVVHFDDYPSTPRPYPASPAPGSPSEVYFTFLPPNMDEAAASALTSGQLYDTPALLQVHYGKEDGRQSYGDSTNEILISSLGDSSDFAVIAQPSPYVLRPTPRSRHSERIRLTPRTELTGYYEGSPVWASRFEVGENSVGFMFHQGQIQTPFVIPRTIAVAKP